MDLIKVNSSNIDSIGFDENGLTIRFKSGNIYQYQDVDLTLFNEFLNSGSKGQFFNTKIKNQGKDPYCVAYSMTTICEFMRKYFKEDIEFDPDWLYKQCKLIDGLDGVAGTYLKCALSIAYNIGMKPVGVDDNDLQTIGKYKIKGYVMIDFGNNVFNAGP